MPETADILHQKFNKQGAQVSPVRAVRFTRKKLWSVFAELGFTKGAEIGVAAGKNALNMCKDIPNLQLHAIDPWVKYRENPRGWTPGHQVTNYATVKEKLEKPYGVKLYKAMSMDAVRKFAPASLDFVYIDGHHSFDYVMQDLIEWSKIVRVGGIVSGHDYYRFRWAGVVPAVDAYTHAHQIHEWFITDEKETTFFWANV